MSFFGLFSKTKKVGLTPKKSSPNKTRSYLPSLFKKREGSPRKTRSFFDRFKDLELERESEDAKRVEREGRIHKERLANDHDKDLHLNAKITDENKTNVPCWVADGLNLREWEERLEYVSPECKMPCALSTSITDDKKWKRFSKHGRIDAACNRPPLPPRPKKSESSHHSSSSSKSSKGGRRASK
jgi:hypothetical protein